MEFSQCLIKLYSKPVFSLPNTVVSIPRLYALNKTKQTYLDKSRI